MSKWDIAVEKDSAAIEQELESIAISDNTCVMLKHKKRNLLGGEMRLDEAVVQALTEFMAAVLDQRGEKLLAGTACHVALR